MTVMDVRHEYAERVGDEVRAMAARRRMTAARLARAIGMTEMTMSRRLSGRYPFDVEELAAISATLGCRVSDLLPQARLPHRDSNTEPAGYRILHGSLRGYRMPGRRLPDTWRRPVGAVTGSEVAA